MVANVLALLVVPAFLVGLAAVVLWCAGRDFRHADRRRARRPPSGGGRHRRMLVVVG